MSDGNGVSKTIPLALLPEVARLEGRLEAHEQLLSELTRASDKLDDTLGELKDLILRLGTRMDRRHREQSELINTINDSVLMLVRLHMQEVDGKPTPPDSPYAKTQIRKRSK